jgi:hypothetical protein
MLLEDAIKDHARAASLLEDYGSPERKTPATGNFCLVRPYIVQAHYRVIRRRKIARKYGNLVPFRRVK